jgi:hypothetical protein
MKTLRRVIASFILAALGCYVLWLSRTTWGLMIGVPLVVLALAISLPAELRSGVIVMMDGAEIMLPLVREVRARARRRPMR